MTSDPAEPSSPPRRSPLGVAVIVLAVAEILAVFGIIAAFSRGLSSSEAMSRNMAQGIIVLTALPLAAFSVPALILGLKGRALKTALVLVLLPIAVFAVLFFFT